MNAGRLYLGRPTLVPGTPLGIMRMLDEYEIPLEGRARRRRRPLGASSASRWRTSSSSATRP